MCIIYIHGWCVSMIEWGKASCKQEMTLQDYLFMYKLWWKLVRGIFHVWELWNLEVSFLITYLEGTKFMSHSCLLFHFNPLHLNNSLQQHKTKCQPFITSFNHKLKPNSMFFFNMLFTLHAQQFSLLIIMSQLFLLPLN